MAPISVQPLSLSDRDALVALDQSAFAFDPRVFDLEADTAWVEWDRAFGARRDDALAGIYVVYSFGLGVPGSPPRVVTQIPMAALTWVAVHPDHRRRGVLSQLIHHHLDGVHADDRGETISGLFASEAPIYGRFGYGVATSARRRVLKAKAPLRAPRQTGDVTTRFETVDPAVHRTIVQRVYDADSQQRPGSTVRPAAHGERHLADPDTRRPGGAEPLKIIVAERDGAPTGYAMIRRTASWGDWQPEGKVQVVDFHALDPQTGYALWRRALDFDLMAEVITPWLPYDDPLLVWAEEAVVQSKPPISLWIRIVDLPGALTSRGYAGDVDVVFDVSDALCPWNAGRWHLAAGPDGASCERASGPADLALDVRELGSAYLGGVTIESLARAGLVDELPPGALAAASAAFRSAVLPATPYMF
jgi:predicted acetyltransferase